MYIEDQSIETVIEPNNKYIYGYEKGTSVFVSDREGTSIGSHIQEEIQLV
ncbi:MAG: hypothetical protein NZ908_02035 [Candidatus Micrarchaeota archaeon]|nr:hypothetical protein [Candidatus Micrarchaeota archaeon]MCX8154324.1 hypothetical protein [Candidatus Micrarchaeota archaeon]